MEKTKNITDNIKNKKPNIINDYKSLDYIKHQDYIINFRLPPILIEGPKITQYNVPNSPHIFHCNEVILKDKSGNIIKILNNKNVICMHGINDGSNHVSSQTPNIKISDIIEKAESNMKGNKIDILAICNKNSGNMEFYKKNEHRRICVLNSNLEVYLTQNHDTGFIKITLTLCDKKGEYTNIKEIEEQEIMKQMQFEIK